MDRKPSASRYVIHHLITHKGKLALNFLEIPFQTVERHGSNFEPSATNASIGHKRSQWLLSNFTDQNRSLRAQKRFDDVPERP